MTEQAVADLLDDAAQREHDLDEGRDRSEELDDPVYASIIDRLFGGPPT